MIKLIRDFQEDIKITIPKQLKFWIISKMMGFYIDNEDKKQLHDYDGCLQINNKKFEFKDGQKIENKLPLEIYTDIEKEKGGWASEARADFIIFVKKYHDSKTVVDIFCMDYKKLVDWWWNSEKYLEYKPYQIIQESYNLKTNSKWKSSHYNFLYDKIPQEIIIAQERFFDYSHLLKRKTLKDFFDGGGF